MKEIKKEQINRKKYITIIFKFTLIISLILIIFNYVIRNDEYSFPFYWSYGEIYVWICLVINLFFLLYKSKNEKSVSKLILISMFLIIMFIIPTYIEYETHKSGMLAQMVEVHTNIYGIRIWSDY